MRKSLVALRVPAEKSHMQRVDHGDVYRKRDSVQGKGIAPGVSGKGPMSKDTAYYGGGKSIQEHANQVKAEAWKELRKDAIKVSRQSTEADMSDFASTLPLQRQKKTQTLIDWENIQLELPTTRQTVSNRKHRLIGHLIRLRENTKYRHKQEKFTVRCSETIAQLARRGVRPEVLLLNPEARVPKGINLEKMPTVLATRELTAMAAGKSYKDGFEGLVAEYIMPDEEERQQLWLSDSASIKRAAIFVGIKESEQLGEQIRSAASLGCDAILLVDGCIDAYHPEVIDASMAAGVTAGGYPRFHVIREEHGDDPWGIINRMISHHGMLPVLSATNNEDLDSASTADQVWRDLQSSGNIDQPMCFFFGDKKYGLDVDYVRHNLEAQTQLVKTPSNHLGLPAVCNFSL